jgi:hypothetical protein
MFTTNSASVGTRIRTGLWRRLLIALAVAVLYVGAATVLVVALPESAWPAIGGDGYASSQATIVPALNLFAVGVIFIAVFAPVVPVAMRIAASIAVGIAAAVAGPLLAALEGTAPAAGLFTLGVIVLGASGIALAAACAATTFRVSNRLTES